MKKKLIFIQLNEINFDELKKYSKNYDFKFFNDEFFKKLSTTTSETKYELLEPWIQWVSIFTGLEAEKHKIFRLGDSENKSLVQFYELIEIKGYTVGAIGPINLKNNLKNSLYYVPDPWSKSNSDNKWINKIISSTIKKFVNENSSKNKSFYDYIKLLFITLVYFRFNNFNLLLKLLINVNHHWNKALLFEFIINNIHIKKIKKFNPNFSSIFFNSGAHIQHHYYFNSKFTNNITNPNWYIDNKCDPIFEMFKFYDEILLEYSNNSKYDLILATGLRQVPYDRVKYYYRLKNHKEFLNKLNIFYNDVTPKMSRDFIIYFDNQKKLQDAKNVFTQINIINRRTIFNFEERESSIFVTLSINEEITDNFLLVLEKNKKIKLSKYVNFIALKNGMHDKKGYFYSNFDCPLMKNDSHVKNIYSTINNYF